MQLQPASARTSWFPKHKVLRIALLTLTAILAFGAVSLPIFLRPVSFPLAVGDVSPQDIVAPQSITYTSDVLTEQARQEAEQSVSPVYLSTDPSIARHQVERMRLTLNYIEVVREDGFATSEQKLSDLEDLQDIRLTPETARLILELPPQRWQGIHDESLIVLEKVMRNTIREDRVEEARRSVPTLISFSMTSEQADIVTELARGFVVPNSLFSQEETEKARAEMRAGVNSINRSFVSGETIVLRGQVINPAAWEALEQLGLVQPQDSNKDLIGAALLTTVIAVFIGMYMHRRTSYPMDDLRSLALIAALFLVFLVGARISIPSRTVIPYLFPMAAFGLTVAVLFTTELGLVFTLILGVMAAFNLPNSLDLTLYYVISGLCGVLALGRARRVINFIWSGFAIGLSGIAIILAYRLPAANTDWLGLATLAGAAMFNGVASASLTLLFQFLFAQILGLTTALQLLEISRPDHALLQFLLRNAPGTYQHSLQVSNLAEQAAESIGADPLLTRVGALYHDIGKALNPLFFIENQVPGKLNPHDDLDPATSAATIIQHVSSGYQLARKHHLPPRICDFILEHHGTLLTRYQYAKAVEAVNGQKDLVDISQFRYPGPGPRSRETALLMLADGCEARARAEIPKNEEELRHLIKRVFEFCLSEGQLDNTTLTLKDLNLAMESFFNTLRGVYHPRIVYPEIKTQAAPPLPEALPAGEASPGSANYPTTPVSR